MNLIFGYTMTAAKEQLDINAASPEYYILRSLFSDVDIQSETLALEVEGMARVLRACMENSMLDLIGDVQNELVYILHQQAGPTFRPSDIQDSAYVSRMWKEFRDGQEAAVQAAVQSVRDARATVGEDTWKGVAWRCEQEGWALEQPLHEVVYS